MPNLVGKKKRFEAAIRKMFGARAALHHVFSKKPFTPDGRMIGDIGEAIAEIFYKVKTDSRMRKDWDGICENKNCKYRDVQIKATQKSETYLHKPPHEGHLLVFKICPDGTWRCFYNGLINKVWREMGGKSGYRFIALERLKEFGRQKNEIRER